MVPIDYQGEIKLFVTKNGFRDFNINKYGVGYIDKENFDRGFYPSIFKGEDNITLDVRDYFKSSSTSAKNVTNSFDYLSFYIGGTAFSIGIDSLIKLNAIDTSILPLKN
ncbi:MAG: hypothetical protein EOO20_20195 [Chryseobacterium sp.]|nr:MAG: hypothetical protein EOO20_20195 [Chryseobacterium sp.]